MTMQVILANRVIPGGFRDRLGQMLIEMKNALVATGLWRVTGSGDNAGNVLNEGQTPAASNGGWDLFAPNINENPYWVWAGAQADSNLAGSNVQNALVRSISKTYAWFQLREVGSTRVLQIRRATYYNPNGEYSDTLAWRFCPSGVKTSTANMGRPPDPTGVSFTWWANPQSTDMSYGAPWVGSGEPMRYTHQGESVFHLWSATDARAGGVCPFYLTVVNRHTAQLAGGILYESMVDVQNNNPHPYLFRMGMWHEAFGRNGFQDKGPFWVRDTFGCTGVNCELWCFDTVYNPVMTWNQPGNVLAAPDASGKWKTWVPKARATNMGYLGRSEHLLVNLVARDYPTTYGLASTDARLAIGQLLLPWKQNEVPIIGY